MRVELIYVGYMLQDYFEGSELPWVTVSTPVDGVTSTRIRKLISEEFRQGNIGGYDPVAFDYIPDVANQKRADEFYAKALPRCLRNLKFRGKMFKSDGHEDARHYFIFKIIESC